MKKFQGVFIKNPREIANLREADRITANILDARDSSWYPFHAA